MSELKFVKVSVAAPVATITLCREPVNGMNRKVWSELLTALDQCESDSTIRACVFESGLVKDVFTAGNDINELYAKATTREKFGLFWHAQTLFLARLYRSPLITCALIRGACPAGGCILALCCDYRVQSVEGDPRIGLNEVALGISVPKLWAVIFAQTVNSSIQAQDLLAKGQMLTSREAVQCGLIHAAVTKDQLRPTIDAELKHRLALPDGGRRITKLWFREPLSRQWEQEIQQETEGGWKGLTEPKTVAMLGKVLAKLSGGAKKSKL